ncbi:KPN_02809 family neutral zinc metallopeptidase [Pseudomarimonas arenosa]|uniref:Neutral zinc metallopeptidase n=1 Tax=Pseudomarimonas arenosa TaxID=2774145 RepID=A0AAW3ZJZ5_9GAMM|nr:neutral zinc metallopeptidase [Pseudomarimonas arenosa]MBD8526321.1 neutral zinc metallopeptidase [Pseudomarimonas arenosa]
MKWQRARQSQNVEDRRGQRAPAMRGLPKMGLGGIALVLIVGWFMGVSPVEMLSLLTQQGGTSAGSSSSSAPPTSPQAQQEARFIAAILGETEDVWGRIFQQSGQTYPAPTLVLFSGQVRSACGAASSAVGPFYCPGDKQVYLDTEFFDQMDKRLGGGGDFAEAYVIAHEVGHHVQTVTGTSRPVVEARRSGQNVEGADGLLVRQELQADCFAGLWAHHAQARHDWLEAGDIEEALSTATAIGDDQLQKQARGTVVPDSFTHGSAEQRVRWFKIGFETGDFARCDTFGTRRL